MNYYYWMMIPTICCSMCAQISNTDLKTTPHTKQEDKNETTNNVFQTKNGNAIIFFTIPTEAQCTMQNTTGKMHQRQLSLILIEL